MIEFHWFVMGAAEGKLPVWIAPEQIQAVYAAKGGGSYLRLTGQSNDDEYRIAESPSAAIDLIAEGKLQAYRKAAQIGAEVSMKMARDMAEELDSRP